LVSVLVLVDVLVVLDALAAFLTALTVLDAQTASVVLVAQTAQTAQIAPDVATDKAFKQVNRLVPYLRKPPVLLQGVFHIR
jgi:hypothetical protein